MLLSVYPRPTKETVNNLRQRCCTSWRFYSLRGDAELSIGAVHIWANNLDCASCRLDTEVVIQKERLNGITSNLTLSLRRVFNIKSGLQLFKFGWPNPWTQTRRPNRANGPLVLVQDKRRFG